MLEFKNITITPQILRTISLIDEFKGRWQATQDLVPDKLESLRKIATIESVGSSTRIEGAKLSDSEVEKLLSNLEQKSFVSRDEQEVWGYADVMNLVFDSYDSLTLSENHIKQLHATLLKYSSKDEEHPGHYKKISNNVEAFDSDGKSIGVVFVTATPFETPIMMKELLTWFNKQLNEELHHPLILIAIFTVTFLAIHPFKDGNGRLSRVLTSLLLLQTGYSYIPYSSMESVIEENKEKYYLALRRTQKTIRCENQDWNFWITFFLSAMEKQTNNLNKKVEQERSLVTSLPALSRRILELLDTHVEISVKEIEEITGANRNTIKAHIKKLKELSYLVAVGSGRGSRYKKN